MSILDGSPKGYALGVDGFAGNTHPPEYDNLRNLVAPNIASICHIGVVDIDGEAVDPRYSATGVVVEGGRILTNRHVLEQNNATPDEASNRWTVQESRRFVIRFDRYLDGPLSAPIACTRVAIADNDADLALLIPEQPNDLPPAVSLSPDRITEGDAIAIGHPDMFETEEEDRLSAETFGEVFPGGELEQGRGVKRLVSGRNFSPSENGTYVEHTMNTTGGSSGSPIFDATTGRWISIHYKGFGYTNSAISNTAIRAFLDGIDGGVV